MFAWYDDLIKWILRLQYLWNGPLYDLAHDLRFEKDLSDTILLRARENFKKLYKLQTILETQFSQVSILQRAFLLCWWVCNA